MNTRTASHWQGFWVFVQEFGVRPFLEKVSHFAIYTEGCDFGPARGVYREVRALTHP